MIIKGNIYFIPSEKLRIGTSFPGVRVNLDVEFTEEEKKLLEIILCGEQRQ